MIRFNDIPEGLTIQKIFEYTYRYFSSRFDNYDRDILPSKISIKERKRYRKNKEGKFSTPDELLSIISWSAPQYEPYSKVKSKKATRQLTVKHHYDVKMAIQKSPNGTYSFSNSKIIWRVGSFKKWQKAPQSQIKSIYQETRERLEKKYKKLDYSKRKLQIKKDIEKIRKSAGYLDNGDFNSQVNGINGDFYFRQQLIMKEFGCLYGPCSYLEPCKDVDLPFFGKHEIGCLYLLIRKGILKVD